MERGMDRNAARSIIMTINSFLNVHSSEPHLAHLPEPIRSSYVSLEVLPKELGYVHKKILNLHGPALPKLTKRAQESFAQRLAETARHPYAINGDAMLKMVKDELKAVNPKVFAPAIAAVDMAKRLL